MKKGHLTHPPPKEELHPRNPHRLAYDFDQLKATDPALGPHIIQVFGRKSIDFSRPESVLALNRTLLKHFYGLSFWDIPAGYLCPPIPGRADYLHYAADLLAAANGGIIPRGEKVRVLDVGVGANAVYPIIGHQVYGWSFVGSDIDLGAVKAVERLVAANPVLQGGVEVRRQRDRFHIFQGIMQPGERFDLTVCNPPFHASAKEALEGTQRKLRNLSGQRNPKPTLNFGGQNGELWCPGGEAGFVGQMIHESAHFRKACFWFTSLISKKATLPGVYQSLKRVGAQAVETIEMAQGQKISRLVAWTFLSGAEQAAWRLQHWPKKP